MHVDRRQFLQTMTIETAAIATGLHVPLLPTTHKRASAGLAVVDQLPRPSKAQQTWQEAEIGLIYHFDLSVAAGDFSRHNNLYEGQFDPARYNPKQLDTDQWLEAAKAAGARYAVFTATHFNGFLQWQSDAYPYGLKQTPWRNGKGDVLGDFIKSCHKANILPGVYISTHRNGYWDLWDYYVDHGKGRGTPKQAQFNKAAEKMIQEICTNYGPLLELWFDAGTKLPHEGGPDVLPIIQQYQPDCLFYHASKRADFRWIGNESGHANYPCWATMPASPILSHNSPDWRPILGSGDPNGTVWSPGMVDVPFRGKGNVHNWFWAPDQDEAVFTKDQLVEMYYQSVGRNCNLVIGEVITPDGLVPASDIKRLSEFGAEIKRRFDKPIAKTKGEGTELVLTFAQPQPINHVVIQEDISTGERVRKYTLEALTDSTWRPIGGGYSIGYKRIEKVKETRCAAIRLTVEQSTAVPQFRNVAVYFV